MLTAVESRSQSENADEDKHATRHPSHERKRRVRRAKLLTSQALYGKAAKDLAQRAALDPNADDELTKLRALHPAPISPVRIIPDRDLPPAHVIAPEAVRSALAAMDKDAAAGPDRAGVR